VRSSCRKDSYYSHRRKELWQEELNSKEELYCRKEKQLSREDLLQEEGTNEGGRSN
jgi:hypothetical protein